MPIELLEGDAGFLFEIALVHPNGKRVRYDDPDDHLPVETILIQTDWEYPAVARNFGWDMATMQKEGFEHCHHQGTDGTVPCKDCGLTQTEFISAAHGWLTNNIGAIAEDPGYFNE